jgi:hypothetical protein
MGIVLKNKDTNVKLTAPIIPIGGGSGSGEDGGYYIPYVDAAGNLSWTPTKSDMEEVESVNIKGKDGVNGKDGKNGIDGQNGYTPVKGVDYFDGKDGQNGVDGYTPVKGVDYFDGKDGASGKDGKTPVKGTDYYTEADKQEMVSLVIASLPNSEEVSY